MLPGRKQREPVNNKEASVPLRRVKAPPRRHTRAKVKPDENLSDSLEHLRTPDPTSPLQKVRGRKRIAPKSLKSSASASSQDEVNERKKMGTVQRKSSRRVPKKLHTSDTRNSSTSSEEDLVRRTRGTRKKQKQSTCTKSPSPPKPSPKLTKSLKKKPKAKDGKAPHLPEQDEDEWTEAELMKLQK